MKAIKITIILCWIMLIVCCIIKLIGGNWFEIICNNEHFNNICDFIDNRIILNSIIGLLIYVFIGYFIFRAMANILKTNKYQKLYIIICLCIVWAFNFWNIFIKSVVEIVAFIISPYIINKIDKETRTHAFKHTWYRGILGYILIFVFQYISLFIRNVGIKITDDSFLITVILSIDYYIMVTLYCLYIKIKVKENKEII